jgi:hypothetical protein
MNYDNNIDDVCWYEVGNRRYYNKLEALFDHINSKQPMYFNVNDEEYSKYDWTLEPETSLDELYTRRARQIREKYDYLVLHFSGGSDSCNILEICIRNNIFIDEIITRGSYRFSSGATGFLSTEDSYSEVLTQGLPLALMAKEKYSPHMRVTISETSEILDNFYKNNPDWFEQGCTGGFTPSNILRSNKDLTGPHWRVLAESGKKIAHIFGADKPKIYRHKDYFYTRWIDKTLAQFNSVKYGNDPHPQYTECFYLGKHAVDIQIKQLHVVKNYIKNNPVDPVECHPDSGRLYEDFIAKLIYHRTFPLICVHGKDDSTTPIAKRDSWFSKDQFSDAYKNWERGVEYLQNSLPPQYLDSKKDLAGIWSKTYFLGA